MEQEIQSVLSEIEEKEHCRILMAVGAGSRAWGVSGPDSDYDVRFLYCRTPQDYLRLDSARDVIEEMREDLDIEGWDLRKALTLLRGGNPTLFEWFASPIRYRNTPEADAIRAVLPRYYDSRKILHRELGMAKHVYEDYLQGDLVAAKRYLHGVHCILSCRWVLHRDTLPPLSMDALAEAELDPGIAAEVGALVELRRNTPGLGPIPRIPALDRYLQAQIAALSQEAEQRNRIRREDQPWAPLNALFLQCIGAN